MKCCKVKFINYQELKSLIFQLLWGVIVYVTVCKRFNSLECWSMSKIVDSGDKYFATRSRRLRRSLQAVAGGGAEAPRARLAHGAAVQPPSRTDRRLVRFQGYRYSKVLENVLVCHSDIVLARIIIRNGFPL